jgi:orotate phosphoribosyltransferase
MDQENILSIFKQSGALLEGHFQLTSGRHSGTYFQCAKVLQYPRYTEMLCGEIAREFRGSGIDAVLAPALGGIVVGQEVGRQLGVRTMFAERKDGSMQLRRGFAISAGEKVLVCEDVVTTGGSVIEVMNIVRKLSGNIAGVGFIVDRSDGAVKFAVDPGGRQYALMHLRVESFPPDACPLCRQALPLVKPGSRGNA